MPLPHFRRACCAIWTPYTSIEAEENTSSKMEENGPSKWCDISRLTILRFAEMHFQRAINLEPDRIYSFNAAARD